jgi:hypothetical protein
MTSNARAGKEIKQKPACLLSTSCWFLLGLLCEATRRLTFSKLHGVIFQTTLHILHSDFFNLPLFPDIAWNEGDTRHPVPLLWDTILFVPLSNLILLCTSCTFAPKSFVGKVVSMETINNHIYGNSFIHGNDCIQGNDWNMKRISQPSAWTEGSLQRNCNVECCLKGLNIWGRK